MDELETQIARLRAALAAQEALRPQLGDAVVDATLGALQEKLAALEQTTAASPQRRQVTILFADLAGFTPLAERLDPEDVRDLMNTYFQQVTAPILDRGGSLEKFIGDAVMAVFGQHTARESDPADAVRAALAMQQALAELNGRLERERDLRLAMRIGVNTGLVLSGLLGGERPADLTVVGDTVNLAARLESAAPPGGVLISQATYNQVRGLFDVEVRPPLAVKGKTEPVQTYLVLREKPRAFYMPTRGLAGVNTRTVGRETELALLQNAYRQVQSGGGLAWITISGEAGVGKTRLLAEFENWLELRPEAIRYLKGRAWPHSQHSPYALLRGLLSFRFQIRDGDRLAEARVQLTAGLQAVLGDALGDEAAAFVGQLIGLDFGASHWIAPIADDTRQIRGRAEVLLREYLARLCSQRPTVLLLEDLHWADAESLALLAAILAQAADWKLCVAGSARPEFWEREVAWGPDVPHYRRLDLSSLPRELAYHLALELLQKVPAPPDWLLALLIEQGSGNPYFTEELIHWLIEQRVIDASAEPWRIAEERLPGLSVPGTVQGVLQARLEGLSLEERATLQHAAVMGRAFWAGAVAYIGQQPVPAERWDRLQQRELVFGQPTSHLPGEQEYHFRHTLLRDVVYEYTLKEQRRIFHHRAAEWLAVATAERAEEWTPVIAHHHEQAGDRAAAAAWYGRAARRAQATYAPEAAIDYYQKALALLPGQPAHDRALAAIGLYEGLGEMLYWQARHAEAAETFGQMRAAAEAVDDLVAQARAWNGMSTVQDKQGNHRSALRSAERALEIAQTAGEAGQIERARAVHNRGFACFRMADLERALALGEQALALSAALGPGAHKEMAHSLNLLGGVHDMLGHFEQAARFQERALALYRELGNRRGVEVMLNNLGENSRLRGDHDRAVALFQEALAIARQIGDRAGEAIYLAGLGAARVGSGQFTAAEADLRQAIQMSETAHYQLACAYAYVYLAGALLGCRRLAEAATVAGEALALGRDTGMQDVIGEAWRVLAIIAAHGGPAADDPRICFGESLRIFAESGMEAELARTLWAWASYELEQGDRERGLAMRQEAEELSARLGIRLPDA